MYEQKSQQHEEMNDGPCAACGAIPAGGLPYRGADNRRICGPDCPGVDSGKWCDHQCVGALITNARGELLLFQRGTYPYVIAGPAGHCDGDSAVAAVHKEVREEVGLQVVTARLITHFWHDARCRRRYAGRPGHYWQFFVCEVTGEPEASLRETQPESLRWYTPDEVVALLSHQVIDPPWVELLRQVREMGTAVGGVTDDNR